MILETNTPAFVADTMGVLDGLGIRCALFGGWAEEAFGLRSPGAHGDIDLLLPAASFEALDILLNGGLVDFDEIQLKRFVHKRAFRRDGIMVEIILVEQTDSTARTRFWGDICFEWSLPLCASGHLHGHPLKITSPENLKRYRDGFQLREPHRWKDPASVMWRP